MDLGLYAVVPGQRQGYQDLLGVPAEVAHLRFLLIQAPGPLFCSIEITGSQGRDAQGVYKHPGPQTQPFLPGLLEISLRPLVSSVRRAHVGVEKAQDLNRAVPAQLVLSGHHGQRPLTMSAGAGQVPAEKAVCARHHKHQRMSSSKPIASANLSASSSGLRIAPGSSWKK